MSPRIACIGAGAMGSALIKGFVQSGVVEPGCISVADHNPSKLEVLLELGVKTYNNAENLLESDSFDMVLLAVKPQVLAASVASIASDLSQTLVVSIAAGVSLEELSCMLSTRRIIRAMPNLGVEVLSGATALSAGLDVELRDLALAQELFGALGLACVMREDQLDVEACVVGCAPAFYALFVDALSRAAIRQGMTAQQARGLLATTMKGVAQQFEAGVHPRVYMDKVTSPGGITAEALRVMEASLMDTVFNSIDAGISKNQKLGK